MIAILVSFVLLSVTPVDLPESLIYDYAARAAGEAGFSAEAHAAVVCTMRNRVLAGWNPYRVLEAYYAPDAQPTAAQIDATRLIMAQGCDPRLYYALGGGDAWRPHKRPPVLTVADPNSSKKVLLYDK